MAYAAVETKKIVNRGFLNGPLCPIYAFGALFIIHLLTPLKDNHLAVFFLSVAITSLIELIGGFLLNLIFKKRWWDYSDRNFNIGGYICLEFSILWGLVSFFTIYGLHPEIEKLVNAFSPGLLKGFVYVGVACILVDFIATVQNILKLNKKFKEIDKIGNEIRKRSDKIGLTIATNTIEITKEGIV